MPIHDWQRIDANLFHDFRQGWAVAICSRLNTGLLPPRYGALLERSSPDCAPGASKEDFLAARGNRIVIQRPLGTAIAVIDIVSPGHKGSQSALRSFVGKTVDFLKRGVHVLVVDLFPPSVRDPQGIHKAIWDEIEDQPFALPPDKPLTLAAYVAALPKVAYVEPVGIGDTLPDMPAFLDVDHYVPVPLEATYESTWASCPEAMREAVEKGEAFDVEA